MTDYIDFNVQECETPFRNEVPGMVIRKNELPCHQEDDCRNGCLTIHDFLNLTDEMTETIISLEEELIRWRQALIKYLPEDRADGLRQDIFNNLSCDFEGNPAYDLYVNLKRGMDPQQSEKRRRLLYRLADGTDETSITYL